MENVCRQRNLLKLIHNNKFTSDSANTDIKAKLEIYFNSVRKLRNPSFHRHHSHLRYESNDSVLFSQAEKQNITTESCSREQQTITDEEVRNNGKTY